MPPRFRRPAPMTSFELVPDDDPDQDPDGTGPAQDDGGTRPTLGARAAAHWRALSVRARTLVAAATCVAVVGVATAVVLPGRIEARGDLLRADAVRGLPGAVDDLSAPLDRSWDFPGSDEVLGVLTGGAVLVREGAAVRAVDAATGSERWAHDVGANPQCGPWKGWLDVQERPIDLVTCLGGPADDRAVTVLDASGAVVGSRHLGAADEPASWEPFDDPVVTPASDGRIAVVDQGGEVREPMMENPPGAGTLSALRERGWSEPTLRLEDALSGEVVAEVTPHLRAQDLASCSTLLGGTEPAAVSVTPSVFTSPGLSVMMLCGAAVALTPDGTALDLAPYGSWPRSLPGGGTVVLGESSTFLDAAGDELATVPGWASPLAVDDDPDGPYLSLMWDETSIGTPARAVATGADGQRLWTGPAGSTGILARVAGTVVVASQDALLGLDAASGAERWSLPGLVESTDDGSGEQYSGVVTDGTRLLVAITDTSGAKPRLVALDARDGRIAWENAVTAGGLTQLFAVGGHPVYAVQSAAGVRGLG